jgi:hypothetical protein
MKIEWSKITYPVIAGLILIFFGWLFNLLKPFFKFILSLFNSIYLFLKISIPIWILLIILAAAIIILFIYRVIKETLSEFPISWKEYTSDNFFGIKFRWGYNNIDNSIDWICCYCPSDDTELIINRDRYNLVFKCETCGKEYEPIEVYNGKYIYFSNFIDRVKRQIIRKIDTGEWEIVVEKAKQKINQGK